MTEDDLHGGDDAATNLAQTMFGFLKANMRHRPVRLGVTRVLPIVASLFHSRIHRSEQGLGGDRLC